MKKTYLKPQVETSVLSAENLVLCASSAGDGSASANDFVKEDLTGDNNFWN